MGGVAGKDEMADKLANGIAEQVFDGFAAELVNGFASEVSPQLAAAEREVLTQQIDAQLLAIREEGVAAAAAPLRQSPGGPPTGARQ